MTPELTSGINVADWQASTERYALSSGVRPAPAHDHHWFAATPWHAASRQALEQLWSSAETCTETIRIMPLWTAIVRLADDLQLAEVTDQRAVTRLAITRSTLFGRLYALLRNYGRSLLSSPHGYVCQSIRAEAVGLPSVTLDKQIDDYVGLHVDDWDDLPAQQRDQARRRLIINLGREQRYFLFLNHSVLHLPTMAGARHNLDPFVAVQHFLRSHTNYPIVRLALYPGEALIAPVQSLLHDGTTEGKRWTDLSISMMGYFH